MLKFIYILFIAIHDEFGVLHLFLFLLMNFGRVSLNSMRNHSQVYFDLIIGFIFVTYVKISVVKSDFCLSS